MVDINIYYRDTLNTANVVGHSFLQVGIYLEWMTPANLIQNAKIIVNYLEQIYAEYMTLCLWFEDEAKKRKTRDREVLEIIQNFKKIGNKILLFKNAVFDTISEFKKRELEIPGERKRIEDEKMLRSLKKALNQKYDELDTVLEQGHLLGQYQELGEAMFQPELELPHLRDFLNSIAAKIRKSYQEVNKEELMAEIQLYLRELAKLSKIISQEFDELSINIQGEIGIWKNVLRNLKDLNPKNYDQMAAQLLVLLHDDDKIYKQIEAA